MKQRAKTQRPQPHPSSPDRKKAVRRKPPRYGLSIVDAQADEAERSEDASREPKDEGKVVRLAGRARVSDPGDPHEREAPTIAGAVGRRALPRTDAAALAPPGDHELRAMVAVAWTDDPGEFYRRLLAATALAPAFVDVGEEPLQQPLLGMAHRLHRELSSAQEGKHVLVDVAAVFDPVNDWIARSVELQVHSASPPGTTAEPRAGGMSLDRMESEWARQNRAGMVTEIDPDHVVLWNFDVGSPELKPEHLVGLDQIFETWQILRLHPSCVMRVEGHTSSSGSERLNRRLSNERAAAVFDNLATRSSGPKGIGSPVALGSSRPWFAESDGEKLAQNRRVEVHFLRPQTEEPAPRKPLGKPVERPAREASAEGLVNGYYKMKGTWDGVPVPCGTAVLLYPQLEVSATLGIDTSSPRTVGLEGLEIVFRERLLGTLDVKTNLSRGTFSVSDVDVPLSPQVELSLLTPWKPLQLNTTWISIPLVKWPVSEGVTVTGRLDVRVKVGIGPGPGSVAFGTSAAIALATLAGVLGITLGTAKLIEYASERGLSRMKKVGFRDCFTLRIAGEATGRYDEAREAAEGWFRGEAGAACWDGWNLAREALDRTPEPRRRAILDALNRRASGSFERLRNELFLKAGGLDRDGPLPTADLERMAADTDLGARSR